MDTHNAIKIVLNDTLDHHHHHHDPDCPKVQTSSSSSGWSHMMIQAAPVPDFPTAAPKLIQTYLTLWICFILWDDGDSNIRTPHHVYWSGWWWEEGAVTGEKKWEKEHRLTCMCVVWREESSDYHNQTNIWSSLVIIFMRCRVIYERKNEKNKRGGGGGGGGWGLSWWGISWNESKKCSSWLITYYINATWTDRTHNNNTTVLNVTWEWIKSRRGDGGLWSL